MRTQRSGILNFPLMKMFDLCLPANSFLRVGIVKKRMNDKSENLTLRRNIAGLILPIFDTKGVPRAAHRMSTL